MSKKNKERREHMSVKQGFQELKKNRFLYLMTVPSLIWVVIFSYVPLYGIIIAFKKFSYRKGIWGSEWSGLDNFEFLFNYKNIGKVFYNTIFLNILFIVATTLVSLLLALMFVEIKNKVCNRIVQTVAIFPHFVSWTVVAMCMTAIVGSGGIVTNVIKSVAGSSPDFYKEAAYWPLILTLVKVWQAAGYGSIVYVAAITGFDQSMYEAAKVDGATRLQCVTRITLPLLKTTAIMLTIMSVGNIFRGDFGMIYAIVRDNSFLYSTTDVIDTFAYRALRELNNLGMSTATSFFQSLVGLILIWITNAITKKVEPDAAIF